MVKIKRGDHETKVSMDSFKNIFEPIGYTIVKQKSAKKFTEPVKDNKNNGKKQED